jgi:hypothetical protein
MSDRITPCYVISSNGFTDKVSYQDDWGNGRSEYIGTEGGRTTAHDLIKTDIRQHWTERNGIPVYFISDHGNEERIRAVRLRRP